MTNHIKEGKKALCIENVLTVASALYGLGTSLEVIREGLRTFKSDINMNPGRFNIFELENVRVMIDYGHNIGGYEFIWNIREISFADALVSAVVLGIGEWVFHKYVVRNVFPDRQKE
ncbi:hypothetical protein [Proteiniborus sp.]|uniref:hypothetical protein n=1 Tax=Proteiniborus sp. TaxID=2079015 RepID=UPI003320072F